VVETDETAPVEATESLAGFDPLVKGFNFERRLRRSVFGAGGPLVVEVVDRTARFEFATMARDSSGVVLITGSGASFTTSGGGADVGTGVTTMGAGVGLATTAVGSSFEDSDFGAGVGRVAATVRGLD